MVFFIIMQAICVKLSCPHVLISPNLSSAGLNGGPIPFIHFVKSSPWCSQDLSCTHPPMQPGLWRKFLGHHCKSRRNACNAGNHWIRTINCEALSLVEFQWVSGVHFQTTSNIVHHVHLSALGQSRPFPFPPPERLHDSSSQASPECAGMGWFDEYSIHLTCICIYVCKDKVTTSGWEREKKRCLHAKLIKGFSQNIAISDNIGIHKAWWGWWGWWGWWTAWIQGITLASIFWDSGPVFFSTRLCCLLGSQRPSARQCHAPWVVNPGSFSNTMLVETFGASQQTLSQRGQAAYLPPSSPDPVSEPVTVELLEAHLRLSKHRLDTRFILPSQPPRPKPRSAVESASARVSIWRRMAWLQDASTWHRILV